MKTPTTKLDALLEQSTLTDGMAISPDDPLTIEYLATAMPSHGFIRAADTAEVVARFGIDYADEAGAADARAFLIARKALPRTVELLRRIGDGCKLCESEARELLADIERQADAPPSDAATLPRRMYGHD